MYAWLWRQLPGPFALRLAIAFLLTLVVIALLFTVVFPYVETKVPINGVTVS